MNYELCKELKDAGFPQRYMESRGTDIYYDTDGDLSDYGYNDKDTYRPPLSELIEACGGDLKLISHCPALPDGHQWCVNKELGSTLEEAVAHLYLALNKK